MLGGVVVEGEQLLDVVGDLRDGLAELRAEQVLELLHCGQGVGAVLGVPDLGERLLRGRVRRLGHRAQHVADLVELMPTSA